MRGDLASRPVGDVLSEPRPLFEGGVKEPLVISQDTPGLWRGREVPHRLLGRQARPRPACWNWCRPGRDCRALRRLGAPALHVYPYPSVDEVIPLMATGRVLPYLDVPFQHSHPDVLKRMKRPASGERNLSVSSAGARPALRS